jgi:hypothetical protein
MEICTQWADKSDDAIPSSLSSSSLFIISPFYNWCHPSLLPLPIGRLFWHWPKRTTATPKAERGCGGYGEGHEQVCPGNDWAHGGVEIFNLPMALKEH